MQISKKEQKNQEKLRSPKGITLVSLVVTIVILIILATVSFNGLVGENGLITQAQKAVEMQKISSVQEELELAKGQAYIEGKGHIDADRYFEILEEEGIIIDKEEDVEKIEEGVYEVTTEEGYVFEVIIPEDGEIEIDYIGKGENIGPRIKEIKVVEITGKKITPVKFPGFEQTRFLICRDKDKNLVTVYEIEDIEMFVIKELKTYEASKCKFDSTVFDTTTGEFITRMIFYVPVPAADM